MNGKTKQSVGRFFIVLGFLFGLAMIGVLVYASFVRPLELKYTLFCGFGALSLGSFCVFEKLRNFKVNVVLVCAAVILLLGCIGTLLYSYLMTGLNF